MLRTKREELACRARHVITIKVGIVLSVFLYNYTTGVHLQGLRLTPRLGARRAFLFEL